MARAGFTLLEVMVALAILAVLSLLTAQSISNGIASRTKFQDEIARESSVQDALRIIQADVSAAFHHRDITIAMLNELKTNPTPGVTPAPDAASAGTPHPTPVPMTGFVGTAEAMYFTALNNVRSARDAKESDQAKIAYFVKSCRARGSGSTKNGGQTKCLYRALSPNLDNDVTKTGPETLLLENIEEFKLRYLGPASDEFVESWKTGEGADPATKDLFPLAVEITLTKHNRADPKDKPYSQTILVPIRFPNNPPPTASGTPPANPNPK